MKSIILLLLMSSCVIAQRPHSVVLTANKDRLRQYVPGKYKLIYNYSISDKSSSRIDYNGDCLMDIRRHTISRVYGDKGEILDYKWLPIRVKEKNHSYTTWTIDGWAPSRINNDTLILWKREDIAGSSFLTTEYWLRLPD
jgi:hypothetical protein